MTNIILLIIILIPFLILIGMEMFLFVCRRDIEIILRNAFIKAFRETYERRKIYEDFREE